MAARLNQAAWLARPCSMPPTAGSTLQRLPAERDLGSLGAAGGAAGGAALSVREAGLAYGDAAALPGSAGLAAASTRRCSEQCRAFALSVIPWEPCDQMI
jgi:hypothetical protein